MGWYVVHTHTGYENQVKEALVQKFHEHEMDGSLGHIMIPSEEVVELKKGKKKISTRKFFPGYIIVEMELTDETWHLVNSLPKVTGFVGGSNPAPLSDDEVAKIKKQVEEGAERPTPKVIFSAGESVRVVDGPFTNFNGIVKEVNEEKGKLKVLVTIFGRATSVELEFLQVEKN
ncbi:MAG TPA: transcription termination/antitermination protein NusG [Proteobacteria bacterium]|nr:transcription termination/antitermination protein NusG [Pseudomonadota bacterium]